ncbi:hypothetical protein FCV25MIE_05127 [Fagus crenata]
MISIGSLELVPCTTCRRKMKKLQRQKQIEKRGSQIRIAKTCIEPYRIGSHWDQDVKHSSISSNCGRCKLLGSRHRNDIALHLLCHWRLCPRRRLGYLYNWKQFDRYCNQSSSDYFQESY